MSSIRFIRFFFYFLTAPRSLAYSSFGWRLTYSIVSSPYMVRFDNVELSSGRRSVAPSTVAKLWQREYILSCVTHWRWWWWWWCFQMVFRLCNSDYFLSPNGNTCRCTVHTHTHAQHRKRVVQLSRVIEKANEQDTHLRGTTKFQCDTHEY